MSLREDMAKYRALEGFCIDFDSLSEHQKSHYLERADEYISIFKKFIESVELPTPPAHYPSHKKAHEKKVQQETVSAILKATDISAPDLDKPPVDVVE